MSFCRFYTFYQELWLVYCRLLVAENYHLECVLLILFYVTENMSFLNLGCWGSPYGKVGIQFQCSSIRQTMTCCTPHLTQLKWVLLCAHVSQTQTYLLWIFTFAVTPFLSVSYSTQQRIIVKSDETQLRVNCFSFCLFQCDNFKTAVGNHSTGSGTFMQFLS